MVSLMIAAVTQGKENITHPWIGIEGQEITQDIARSLGMTQPAGFLVKSLHPASPAAKAGLRVGDVIVSVNGHDVEDPEDFHYRITALSVSSIAAFGIIRQGEKSTLSVTMIAPPENPPRHETLVTGRNPVTGAKIANLSPAVAEEIGLHGAESGVVVTKIQANTLAANMGLQAGDILVSINNEKIENVDDAITALTQPARSWRITIRRGDSDVTMIFGG
jgi:serine protease Do